jgi:hypothetical protein
VVTGYTSGPFYRGKSPGALRTTSRILSPMELKIKSDFGLNFWKSIPDRVSVWSSNKFGQWHTRDRANPKPLLAWHAHMGEVGYGNTTTNQQQWHRGRGRGWVWVWVIGFHLPTLAGLALGAGSTWAGLWATVGLRERRGRGDPTGPVDWVLAQGHIGNRKSFLFSNPLLFSNPFESNSNLNAK